MSRLIPYVFLLLFLLPYCSGVNAQVRPRVRVDKPIKPKVIPMRTDLSIGLGYTKSVLFLSRNTKEHNDARGITFNATYGGNKPFRLCVEYTRYLKTEIAPTWYNIKASTIEVNGQALYRSKGNIGFYLLSGFSYNVFKGFFTGVDDYLNLTALYDINKQITTRWLGLNAGVGFEYSIKRVILFGSYKMRIGRSADSENINIQDVVYSVGLRYNFRVPSVYRLIKGPKNRYFLNAD